MAFINECAKKNNLSILQFKAMKPLLIAALFQWFIFVN